MAELVLKSQRIGLFAERETRERFVRFVARMLSAEELTLTLFPLNESFTDLEWGVDQTNDWFVFFDRHDPSRVRISHRYHDTPALAALCGWVANRWNMDIEKSTIALAA